MLGINSLIGLSPGSLHLENFTYTQIQTTTSCIIRMLWHCIATTMHGCARCSHPLWRGLSWEGSWNCYLSLSTTSTLSSTPSRIHSLYIIMFVSTMRLYSAWSLNARTRFSWKRFCPKLADVEKPDDKLVMMAFKQGLYIHSFTLVGWQLERRIMTWMKIGGPGKKGMNMVLHLILPIRMTRKGALTS